MKKRVITFLFCCVFFWGIIPAVHGAGGDFIKIYHIDCGRKYFSREDILDVIDIAALYDYSHIQLAFGNNGLRFIPDNMELYVCGQYYDSASVSRAIEEGNARCFPSDPDSLSQSEMDEIICYARSKGISIIPLLNSPGHMNALLCAGEKLTGEKLSYMDSVSTIDVCNELAVEFAQAVLRRYAEYFSSHGCRYFNLGADEYANDSFSTGSMGFGNLIAEGKYGFYADYLNSGAEIIKAAGMEPLAFNDGLYFSGTRSCGGRDIVFDNDIIICYWQSGWGEYITCPAAELSEEGFRIISTNNNWYYVLGKRSGGFSLDFARLGSSEVSCDIVAGDYYGKVSPVGVMACLWCDEPEIEYSSEERYNVRELVRLFACNNSDYFSFVLPKPVERRLNSNLCVPEIK